MFMIRNGCLQRSDFDLSAVHMEKQRFQMPSMSVPPCCLSHNLALR